MKTRDLLETGQECEFLVQDIGKSESMGDGLTRVCLCSNKGPDWLQAQTNLIMSRRAMLEIGRELIRLASSTEEAGTADHTEPELGETAH